MPQCPAPPPPRLLGVTSLGRLPGGLTLGPRGRPMPSWHVGPHSIIGQGPASVDPGPPTTRNPGRGTRPRPMPPAGGCTLPLPSHKSEPGILGNRTRLQLAGRQHSTSDGSRLPTSFLAILPAAKTPGRRARSNIVGRADPAVYLARLPLRLARLLADPANGSFMTNLAWTNSYLRHHHLLLGDMSQLVGSFEGPRTFLGPGPSPFS